MKSELLKKMSAATVTAAMAFNALAVAPVAFAEDTKYEFEDGTLTGATIQESGTERYQKGASGDKFVFLQEGGETAAVTVTAPETGMYEVTLCYAAPFGDKIHNLYVNGVDQGQFSCAETAADEWVEISLGSVKLNKGENEIMVKSSWGWTDIDYITVKSASLPPISVSDTTCCDKNAISAANSLMAYMASVYGEHIISGQQEIYSYGPHGLEYEFEYIKEKTGESPAIRGFDYGNFTCPAFGSDDGSTDRIIDWVKNKNGIATSSWHLNVPTDFENYTSGSKVDWAQTTYSEKTDFSPSKAATPGTKENEYYMQALTTLAAEFKKLEAENIPVIWRPLHEAEGGGGEKGSWFWWGREGSEAYKKLWIYTYKTLTEDFDCHNLIWEWNSYAYESSANWYPGDEYVDLIAYDKYNCTDWSTGSPVLTHNDSAISSTFYTIMQKYGSKKMIAMSENDSIPTVENLIAEKAGWLYFCPWYDGGSDNINFLSNPVFNTVEDLTTMYQSDYCITLDELPADLYSFKADPTEPTEPTEPTQTTEPTETTKATTTTTTEPDEPEFEVKKYSIDNSAGGSKLEVTFNGTAGAYTNGCFGYADGMDWISEKWEATLDANGNAVVEYEIPAGVTNLEVQIWWASVGEELADNSLVKYSIDGAETEVTTEATTGSEVEVTVWGDANCDGEVSVADAVAVAANIVDSKKNSLTDVGRANADVHMTGNDLNASDALAIQQFATGVLKKLPVTAE